MLQCKVGDRKKLEQAFDSTVRDFVPVATLPFIANDPQLEFAKTKTTCTDGAILL